MYKYPLMCPLLPTAEEILPYIHQIDQNRQYSNFGPLVATLESQLAAHWGKDSNVKPLMTTNGTLGLHVALAAHEIAPQSYCMMPSWTFAATPAAAIAAGLTPYFVDVDPNTQMLTPALVQQYIQEAPYTIGAIIIVSPFGAPLDAKEWDSLTKATGVPVVLDAAAGFDSLIPGRSVSMVSLHATKIFGIGEGGLILTTDPALRNRVRSLTSFGFNTDRVSHWPGINAKLSEYAAAVGLAAYQQWHARRQQFIEKAHYYRFILPNAVRLQQGWGTQWFSSTCLIQFQSPISAQAVAALAAAGIEARQWWGHGCHSYPAYARYPRTDLPVTKSLGETTLAIPFGLHLTPADQNFIAATLDAFLTSHPTQRQA